MAAFPATSTNRTPYTEYDEEGRLTYVEHHRTVGDRIRELVGAGFVPAGPDRAGVAGVAGPGVGAVEPAARQHLPGTAIFVSTLA